MSNLEPVLGGDDTVRRNFSKIEDLYTSTAAVDTRVTALEARVTTLETIDGVHYVGTGVEPAFKNSWVNLDAGTPGVGTGRYAFFYKDRGRVYLEGVIKTGASGTVAFTLPAGYLPRSANGVTLPVNANTAHANVAIAANGDVFPTNVGGSAVAAFCFLDGVSFRAA